MSENVVLVIVVFALASWGAADLLEEVWRAIGPWVRRCADNIARRVSPCPVCEGWGSDPDEPGASCPRNCAAARRANARMAEFQHRMFDHP